MPMKNYFSRRGNRCSSWQGKIPLRFLAILLIFLGSVQMSFSQNTKTVTGNIVDASDKEPIIGASVLVDNSTIGTVTDIDGNYSISVPVEAKQLKISFIGYHTQKINIGSNNVINIELREDNQLLDEVVVVGYGTQKKATLTGAVVAVSNEEITMTKSQNAQNMLTGKVPGVRVIQKTSEPGEFSNQFDIRGFGAPLVVIDGIPRGEGALARLSPDEIESISVLKDASAAIYGVKGGNGVVLVTTKKGDKGKTEIDFSMYYGIQFPAELLKPVGAIDRMTLFNEKSMRSMTNPELTYSEEEFEAYRTGQKRESDWYDATLRDIAPQEQYNVSVSGGSEKNDYFINMAYTKQGGFFKSKDLNYDRFNLRSNLNSQISKRLKVSLSLNGILDTKRRPRMSTWEVYKTLWRSVPTESIYANDNPAYFGKSSSDINNVVAMTNSDVSGYVKNRSKMFQSSMSATYDIPYVDGLSAKGTFSYDNTISDNTTYTKQYNEYVYDKASDKYTATAKNSPTDLSRYYGNSETRMWNISLNYEQTFFEKHNVKGLILYEESVSSGDNISAFRQFSISLPYLFAGESNEKQVGTSNPNGVFKTVSKAVVGRVNYDYEGKYMVEFNFRNDGSSMFSKKKQWGFFPGFSAGWRISEESFVKNNLSFIDNLKLRGSYGEMGDDSSLYYQWLTGYSYPNTDGGKINNYPTGYVFDGAYTNALGFRVIANPDLTWMTLKTYNLGLDADLWNGLLGFTIDAFMRNRTGIPATRYASIPGTFGSSMPQENLNSDRTKGLELELRHRHKIGEVSYNITGNISFTRSMYRYKESGPYRNSYDYWRNSEGYRYNDIWFGKGSNGRYTSYDQIANSPVFTGNGTLPGDYIYEDWNGDGVIDGWDDHVIATTTDSRKSDFQDKRNYPLLNFGITLGAQYKGFDFNLLFQGSAMSYVAYGEQLIAPLQFNGNALDRFLDRWHPNDPLKDPYDRSNTWSGGYYSYGGTAVDSNSRFAIQDGSYLRLKSAEIGYTMPASILSKIGIKNLRMYVNGYNIFTVTGVKGLDPEHPTELYGYMYPLNRTVNFGFNITY